MVIPGVRTGPCPLVVAPHTSLPPPVVVRLPWSPGSELQPSLSPNPPALLLTAHLSLYQIFQNDLSDSGGMWRIQTETSLSFVVGGVAPVSVEPEDGAERFAVHECGLLPRLDHHQASRLVDPLTGSLGESQGLQQWRNISVPP